MMSRVMALAVLIGCSGCGGVISSVYIVQGQLALSGARVANAENLATYEYVSADAYLKKAREAHSYADFEHALRFARLATERAALAQKKALQSHRADVAAPPSPTDAVTPAPAPPPPAPAAEGQSQQGENARPPIIIKKLPEADANEPAPPPMK
jgi:hypothetical protein